MNGDSVTAFGLFIMWALLLWLADCTSFRYKADAPRPFWSSPEQKRNFTRDIALLLIGTGLSIGSSAISMFLGDKKHGLATGMHEDLWLGVFSAVLTIFWIAIWIRLVLMDYKLTKGKVLFYWKVLNSRLKRGSVNSRVLSLIIFTTCSGFVLAPLLEGLR